MVYRPRDTYTAAFFNDVARLKLLVLQEAPGGLVYRFSLENILRRYQSANKNGENGLDADGQRGAMESNINNNNMNDDEDESEEDEAEYEESFEAALEADADYQRLQKLYTLEEEDFDPEEGEDDGDMEGAGDGLAGDDGSGPVEGLYDPEVVEADMAAQERDFARYKRLLRHQMRERAIAEALARQGLINTGENAACVRPYGLGLATKLADPRGGVGEKTPLAVRWVPVPDSPYTATALHWAVLGRAHDTVRFLVENGASADADVAFPEAAAANSASGAFAFPAGLSPSRLASMNFSGETDAVLVKAVADRAAFCRSMERAKQTVEGSLEQRKARQEKRKLGRDQRRAAREDRRAAAEEEEEGEEGEEGREGDDGEYSDGNAVTGDEGDADGY